MTAFWLQPLIPSRAIYVPDDSGAQPPYYWVPTFSGDVAPMSGADMGDVDENGVPDWRDQFNTASSNGTLAWWEGGSFMVNGAMNYYWGQYHPLLEGDSDGDGIPDSLDSYPNDPSNNSFFWAGGTVVYNNQNYLIRAQWWAGSPQDSNGDSIPDVIEQVLSATTSDPSFHWWPGGSFYINNSWNFYPGQYFYGYDTTDSDADGIPDIIDPYPSDGWNGSSYYFAGGDWRINGVLTHFTAGYRPGSFSDDDNDGLPDEIDPCRGDATNNTEWWSGGSWMVSGTVQTLVGRYHATNAGDRDGDGIPDDADPFPDDFSNDTFYWAGGTFMVGGQPVFYPEGYHAGSGVDTDGDGIPDVVDPFKEDSTNNQFYWQGISGTEGVYVDGSFVGISAGYFLGASSTDPGHFGSVGTVAVEDPSNGTVRYAPDRDGDGIPDAADPYPEDATNNTYYVWPPLKPDGSPDTVHYTVNNADMAFTSTRYSWFYTDSDGDGIPDVCDPLGDDPNNGNGNGNGNGNDTGATDTDGDGIPDEVEAAYGWDIYNPADALVVRTDGLTNLQAYQNGLPLEATPMDSALDTDGDGMPDVYEILQGLDRYNPYDAWASPSGDFVFNFEKAAHSPPISPWEQVSQDDYTAFTGRGLAEVLAHHNNALSNAENDWDGDGVSNMDEEWVFHTDLADASSVPADADIMDAMIQGYTSLSTNLHFCPLLFGVPWQSSQSLFDTILAMPAWDMLKAILDGTWSGPISVQQWEDLQKLLAILNNPKFQQALAAAMALANPPAAATTVNAGAQQAANPAGQQALANAQMLTPEYEIEVRWISFTIIEAGGVQRGNELWRIVEGQWFLDGLPDENAPVEDAATTTVWSGSGGVGGTIEGGGGPSMGQAQWVKGYSGSAYTWAPTPSQTGGWEFDETHWSGSLTWDQVSQQPENYAEGEQILRPVKRDAAAKTTTVIQSELRLHRLRPATPGASATVVNLLSVEMQDNQVVAGSPSIVPITLPLSGAYSNPVGVSLSIVPGKTKQKLYTPVGLKLVDRDDPKKTWADAETQSGKQLYAGNETGDMVKWSLDSDYLAGATFTWTAEGPENKTGPTGVGKNEWKIADGDEDVEHDWIDWKPGKYSIKCRVSKDGRWNTVAFDQEVGVRTDDVVIVGWIDKDQVTLDTTDVQYVVSSILPKSGLQPSDPDGLKIDAAALLLHISTDGVDSDFSVTSPLTRDYHWFSDATKKYTLNWMFKYASNPSPPQSFTDEKGFFSQSNLDAFASQNKQTLYKLINHYQVKFLVDDNKKFKTGSLVNLVNAANKPSVYVGNTKDPARLYEVSALVTSLGSLINGQTYPEGGVFSGVPGPNNSNVPKTTDTETKICNEGRPDQKAIDAFEHLTGNDQGQIWSSVTFFSDLQCYSETISPTTGQSLTRDPKPKEPSNARINTQVYPTYWIYLNGIKKGVQKQADSPSALFPNTDKAQ